MYVPAAGVVVPPIELTTITSAVSVCANAVIVVRSVATSSVTRSANDIFEILFNPFIS